MPVSECIARFGDEFDAKMTASLKRDGESRPQHTPRASGIDRCARAMTLDIVKHEARPPFTPWQVARMNRGTEIEKRVIAPRLQEMGFEVSETQMSLTIRDKRNVVICTGHPDGVITYLGRRVVWDVKTVAPFRFPKFNRVEDFWDDDWSYRQPTQLLLYMSAMNIDLGVLILDDCMGHQKLVFVPMAGNEQRVEDALLKCGTVMQHVRANTLPDFHDSPSDCRRCRWFGQGCEPPMDFETSGGIKVIGDEDLAHALATRESNAEAKKDYDWADRIVGKAAKAQPDGTYLCGDFRIEITRSPRAGFTVEPSETVRKKIERLVPLKVSNEPPSSAVAS